MLSYMKVMHYGLMFPKACYGDAALIWNALCGKWIYRSGEKMPGVGADHNLKLDLIGSSKSPCVWMFGTYVQSVLNHEWATEATRMHKCTGGVCEDTCENRDGAIAVATRSEKKKYFHH